MYEHSADIYDVLGRHLDYDGASERLRQLIGREAPDARTLLDVGCGTGRHLELLQPYFEVEGLDLSPEMLRVAAWRCPGVPLNAADLVDFDLGRTFDVVCCLFGSIGYARTTENLARATRSMARHLRPGGLLVIEPWVTVDSFISGKLVHDHAMDGDLAISRMYVTKREGRLSIYEIDYLVGTHDGVRHFTEHQELGLFEDDEYRRALDTAGFEILHSDAVLFGYGLYVARLEG